MAVGGNLFAKRKIMKKSKGGKGKGGKKGC
jgi:hypothetical protein